VKVTSTERGQQTEKKIIVGLLLHRLGISIGIQLCDLGEVDDLGVLVIITGSISLLLAQRSSILS
jgi:hypothetical protein